MCIALSVWRNWEYLPGTYYVDSDGHPHGTGQETYYYDSGRIRLVESYRAGVIVKQTYYRPNGEVIVTSAFDKERGGVFYVVRQDGTIRAKYPCQFSAADSEFLAHGEAIYFRPDGTVEKTMEYLNGMTKLND
jgi:antitoxin component YwqK of YwqJK toxin-antitoxin module